MANIPSADFQIFKYICLCVDTTILILFSVPQINLHTIICSLGQNPENCIQAYMLDLQIGCFNYVFSVARRTLAAKTETWVCQEIVA